VNRALTVTLITAAGASLLQAQSLPATIVSRGIAIAGERQQIPLPGKPPLQPSGFPGLPPKFEELPPGILEQQGFRIEKAGTGGLDKDVVKVRDGAEFWYKGYHVFADQVDGSLQTNIFTLRGHVKVLSESTTVVGDRITVNFDNKTYLANDAESQLTPEQLQGNLKDNLYVKAAESYGSEREIWSHDGSFTTCNLPEPHYHIDVQDSDVRRGKRAILRHTKIVLFGRTILNIPFISVPLDDPSNRYTPEVGQSEDEGYFIKSRWGIPIKGQNDLTARVDYMTKLGLGLGADYRYANPTTNGILKVYKIIGSAKTLNISSDHRQEFKFGTFTFNTDYQKDNYLTAPGSTLWNTRAQLALPVRNGNTTRINFTKTSSSSGGFETSNQTISVSDQRNYGPKTRSTVDISLQNNSSTYTDTSTDRTQVGLRLQANHDFNAATANFEYVRTIPVGDAAGVFSSGDRTPFVSLTSDSTRLIGSRFGQSWPLNGELSFGEFSNYTGTDTQRVGRYNFDLRLNRPDRSDKRFRLDVAGQFKQGFYSDDTAQYTHGANLTASYRLGRDTAANLRYYYTRQYGYSPVTLDSIGRSNLVTADVTYRPFRPLLIGAQSGYDIVRLDQKSVPWNQVGIRTEYAPRENFLFRTYSNYDTFQQQWSSVKLDVAYHHNDQFLAFGAQYDGVNKVWSSANLFLQNYKIGRTQFSAIFSYNGFTKQFDSMQFNFIYDLHCAEMVLSYSDTNFGFRSGRQIGIFIRLKALPFDIPFGFGTQGQPISTPTGFGY
jgi:LPS-assembly protein